MFYPRWKRELFRTRADCSNLWSNITERRYWFLEKVIEEKMTYLNFWNISIVSFIDLPFALVPKHPHWEAATRGVLRKKLFLEISKNPQENTCARVSLKACNVTKKETLTQVFFCAFCEISKNTFLQNWTTVCSHWRDNHRDSSILPETS